MKRAKKEQIGVEYVGIEEIQPYQNNARAHGEADVDAIVKSIQEFGFNDPIGVWKGTIVEGHGRLLAAKKLGMETVLHLGEILEGVKTSRSNYYTATAWTY